MLILIDYRTLMDGREKPDPDHLLAIENLRDMDMQVEVLIYRPTFEGDWADLLEFFTPVFETLFVSTFCPSGAITVTAHLDIPCDPDNRVLIATPENEGAEGLRVGGFEDIGPAILHLLGDEAYVDSLD